MSTQDHHRHESHEDGFGALEDHEDRGGRAVEQAQTAQGGHQHLEDREGHQPEALLYWHKLLPGGSTQGMMWPIIVRGTSGSSPTGLDSFFVSFVSFFFSKVCIGARHIFLCCTGPLRGSGAKLQQEDDHRKAQRIGEPPYRLGATPESDRK